MPPASEDRIKLRQRRGLRLAWYWREPVVPGVEQPERVGPRTDVELGRTPPLVVDVAEDVLALGQRQPFVDDGRRHLEMELDSEVPAVCERLGRVVVAGEQRGSVGKREDVAVPGEPGAAVGMRVRRSG